MSSEIANPLHQLHESAGAEFQSYGEVEIVSTFGEPQAEYAVLHKSRGKMDLPQRAVIEARGADRLDFLNKFLTCELIGRENKKPLSAGQGRYGFALNNKGRILADLNVLELGDKAILETDARIAGPLLEHLRKFIFSEKVEFARMELHEIAVHGPRAADALRLLGVTANLNQLDSAKLGEIIVWRDDPTGTCGYFLIASPVAIEKIWRDLETQGVRSIGWAPFNSTRIEAGRPIFGIDFDDSVLPAETGLLERAVSFTKGCYLGQEIVARMHARGQAARQIVGIRMNGDFLPMAGAPVFDDAKNQVGVVTSSTVSPILSNAAIALAMMKKPFANLGTIVQIAAEGAMRPAAVVEIPFLKP